MAARSGIYQGFPADVYADLPDGPAIVECKSLQHGWRTGDRMMGHADLLVIKRDRATPSVCMTWPTFERLIKMAHQRGND